MVKGDNVETFAKANNEDDIDSDDYVYSDFYRGQPEVLEVLAKHKPNLVNTPNNDKRTCLHLSVIKQFPRCLQVLLKYNADVNLQVSCCI